MQSPAPGQQQQQQMIVTTDNQPQPATQWVVAAPPPTTVSNYMYRHSTVHGMILIIVGTLSIVFNIVDLAVWSNDDYEFTSLGFVGHGFWCGVMCIIAGGFGIGAGRSRNSSCQIRAFLVLSIIAACFCFGQFITAVIGAAVVGSEYSTGDGYYGHDLCCAGSCSFYDYHSYHSSSSSTTCNQVRTLIAMEALLAILSVIGGVAAISGSVLGCRVACCCCSCCCCVDPYQQQFAIIQNNGIPMTIITQQQQQQQGGQMVPVQYPAQYPMQYPMNYSPAYPPAGGHEQPGYQFTAAPPYYPPPSTALTSPQHALPQPGAPLPPAAAAEPVYKNC